MPTNVKTYYQETDMRNVLEFFAKAYKPPGDATLLKWDANYDSHTGKVWFRLDVELPEPVEKNVIERTPLPIKPYTCGFRNANGN